MKILVLNSGSSSIKYALFEMQSKAALITGLIERIGEQASVHSYHVDSHDSKLDMLIDTHQQGLTVIFNALSELGLIETSTELMCIGHRVVHGGEYFHQPTLIDEQVLANIKQISNLAPLHNPANIMGIEAATAYAENIPQVAIFDTAFHQTMPAYAYQYAVPQAWYIENGVRRYGFHGTSHFYVAKQAAVYLHKPLDALNLITLHLGNGASVTAISQGKSVDTSMGMTPLEGVMMGTRSGDLDPAIIFYLQRLGFSAEKIEKALNKESGLKGICNENDMRAVQKKAAAGDESAQLALAMYSYRLKKYMGAYSAVLGRVDAIIFTGGIGENAADIRQACCADLSFMGIEVDKQANQQGDYNISTDNSRVKVLVIATNEELEIAEQAMLCVQGQ